MSFVFCLAIETLLSTKFKHKEGGSYPVLFPKSFVI